MGKAQSKRSVDITTEAKKGTEEEITEKMGKIEDLDKKEVINGDATLSEKNDQEKKNVEDIENDKDMTTEKDVDVQASGDSADPQNTVDISKDEVGSATAEEISPLSDESIKKSKKDKVKKKWSFRSISFGKKDKQKPAKTEETAEDDSAAVNGTDAEEKRESEDTQKNKPAKENDENATETHENGNASPQELNEEEKLSGEKSNDITGITTSNSTNPKTCEPVQNETAAMSSELSEKTEKKAVHNETKISENASVDASKNGNGVVEKRNALDQEPLKTDEKSAFVEDSEKISPSVKAIINETSATTTNGEVVDQIHQNGDHGESEQAVNEKSKAKIEVNTNTDYVSAATLDTFSSISINPSNVQTHVQDSKASSKETEDIFKIDNDKLVTEIPTDFDINTQTVDQSVQNEVISIIEVAENKAQVNIVSDESSKTVDNEKSFQEKFGVDTSPPPLPISPPPSQVSVFAFTNNEDSILTKNFEPALNNSIEMKTNEIPLTSSKLPATEIDNSRQISSIPKENETISQEQDTQLDINGEVNFHIEIKSQENKVEPTVNMCKDLKTNNGVPVISVDSEELQLAEESSVAFAGTIINEITETAAEIVKNQLNCNKEQIMIDLSSHNNETVCQDEVNKENITHTDKPQDYQELMCANNKNAEELPLVIEPSNTKTIECSLYFTEPNLIHQNEEEMNSTYKCINLDEIHSDPTKEFASAKDVKENVTVAEITQDLTVTCE